MKNSHLMNNGANAGSPGIERCLYCGQPAGIVWVHGHGQCAACGTNVEECCRGESSSSFSAGCLKDQGRTGKTWD